MSENTNLVPKRRFKEFQNIYAWEHCEWKEKVEISTNMVDPKAREFGELLHVGPGNIESFTGRILDNVRKVKDDKLISGKFHFNSGDVIYGKINPQLRKYAMPNFEGLASADAYVLNAKNGLEQSFLYTILQTRHFFKYSVSVSMRTGMPKINRDELNQFKFLAPTLEEQKKIGLFFTNLDSLITFHQCKLGKIKSLKYAYLSEMFPIEGEREPKRRFAGFIDAWEQRELGKLADVYDGTHQTPNYTDSGVMFLSVENIKTLQSEKFISEDDFIRGFEIFPQKGDVLMTRIGDIGTANVVESDAPKAYYVSLALLKPKELNPYFLKECISSEAVKKELWKRTLHIAFPKKINKNEIANLIIPYPVSEDEQQKIGEFFRNLDNLIALQQRKLEKLQRIKKAFLNEMFI